MLTGSRNGRLIDYLSCIEKAARLGFDCLEIACTPFNSYPMEKLLELRKAAEDNGIFLTAGHGPSAEQNLASSDSAIVKNAFAFSSNCSKHLRRLP